MSLRIISISALRNLPLRRAEKLLSKTSLYPSGIPALYEKSGVGSQILQIQCELVGFPTGDASSYVLRGRIGEGGALLFVSAPFSIDSQPLNLSVSLAAAPAGFVCLHEPVRWEVSRDQEDTILTASQTVLELYFVPKAPPGANRGVPYEALLHIQEAIAHPTRKGVQIEGQSLRRAGAPDDDVRSLVNSVFERTPPRYDTVQGAAHFVNLDGGLDDITLDYAGYRKANGIATSLCNCRDIAAVLQYLVELTSQDAQVMYTYMRPFGYMKEAGLIGRGECNNPFFGDPSNNRQPVCGRRKEDRSWFDNHSFVYLREEGTVADSCAGPHKGDETPDRYVAIATDDTVPKPPQIERGTAGDIDFYTGVAQVSKVLPSNPMIDSLNLAAFVEAVAYDRAAFRQEEVCSLALPDLLECPRLDGPWQMAQDEIHPGYPVSRRRMVATNGAAALHLDMAVASDSARSAHRHYLALGSSHQMPKPIYEKGPAWLGRSSGQRVSADDARYLWVRRNFVFSLRGYNLPFALVADIARWLDETVADASALLSEENLPQIHSAEASSVRAQVGDTVTLSVVSSENAQLFVSGKHPGLFIEEEDAGKFSFRSEQPSSNHIVVHAVDPRTLLSSKRDVFVVVE